MDLGLQGKQALVTGGTHGIGRATAVALAAEGCHVAVCSRQQERIDATVAMIRDLHEVDAWGVKADVLERAAVDGVIDAVCDRWGGVDITINNVGGGGRWGSSDVITTEERVWYEVMEKNAMVARHFTVGLLPHMLRRGWGRVVTVSSTHGLEAGGRPWFTMAKMAEIGLMKTLSRCHEYARRGLTFNSVAPGAVMIPDTGWAEQRADEPDRFRMEVEDQLPRGVLGTPEEVAAVVVFLCSEAASWVSGSTVLVDGGESRVIS